MTNLLTYEELKNRLGSYYGTERYYKFSLLSSAVMTDGVKYFCDTCSCYWLIDNIFIKGLQKVANDYSFLILFIKVSKKGNVKVTVKEDSGEDMPVLFSMKGKDLLNIIPSGEYKLYYINNVLLLPSEY